MANEQEKEKEFIELYNFTAYKPGIKTSPNSTIEHIISTDENHAVFTRKECFGVSWLAVGISTEKTSKLREVDAIFLNHSEINRGISNFNIENLYGSALSSILCNHSDEDIEIRIACLVKAIESAAPPNKKIWGADRFNIWQTDDLSIEYQTKNPTGSEKHALQRFHKADAYIRMLIPTGLSKPTRLKVNSKLGTALISALDQSDKETIEAIFLETELQVKNIIENSIKANYILLTSLTTCILISVTYLFYKLQLVSPALNTALIPIAGGFLGTYISVLSRSNEINLNEQNSDTLILLQGALRVVMGGTFGLVGYSCAEANIALGVFKDSTYTLLVLGVISGFSERLIPELISGLSREPKQE